MFCPNCGSQNPDGAPFCSACGQAMSAPQAPVQQPVYGAPVYGANQKPAVPGKGLSIASMVLGIVSLALFCVWYLAIPCSIVGVALGGVAFNKAKEVGMKNAFATTGIVCSCVALGITLLILVLGLIGLSML